MLTKEQEIYKILHAELRDSVNNETLYELAQKLAVAFETWHENTLKDKDVRPREPTEAMLQAAYEATGFGIDSMLRVVWTAMWNAYALSNKQT